MFGADESDPNRAEYTAAQDKFNRKYTDLKRQMRRTDVPDEIAEKVRPLIQEALDRIQRDQPCLAEALGESDHAKAVRILEIMTNAIDLLMSQLSSELGHLDN